MDFPLYHIYIEKSTQKPTPQNKKRRTGIGRALGLMTGLHADFGPVSSFFVSILSIPGVLPVDPVFAEQADRGDSPEVQHLGGAHN
ncbi:MAG: hypothetical protein KA731_02270 [Candidatus Moranbacteria bacterium]|nr:hypothetical protein [Candidatus Moranbacteria bacterium]MBP6034228.1 hypothetical protein [Candidatus Moranbacteria bacterium]